MAKRDVHIMEEGYWRRIVRRIFPNRQVKDRLFKAVFAEKKYLLELYNALNDSHYTREEDLQIYTMEDVIYLKMKNDVSFLVDGTLNLYEHQSSYNPNMPLRGLLYLARQYEDYINDSREDIYGSRLIQLPTPRYVVFYNGKKKLPDSTVLLLSDAFEKKEKQPALECRVELININAGRNAALMKHCERLRQYSRFIEILNGYVQNGMRFADAVSRAVDQGIEEKLLPDILLKQKGEVYSMLLTEYDEKRHMKNLYETGKQDGIQQGMQKGIQQGIQNGIGALIELCQELELSREETTLRVAEKFSVSVEKARHYVEKYWKI